MTTDNASSTSAAQNKIPVGISSCLLGEKVRFDGGHKGHSYIQRTLSEYFEFKAFCPEMAIGLGVPRKPIRLLKTSTEGIRCVSVDDFDKDFTDDLVNCANKQTHWQSQLCGYILKKDSPSCGMERVKIWNDQGAIREGVGVYAKELLRNFPYLPVEEEGRLGDAIIRENFIQRVFVLHRWNELIASGLTVTKLVNFHARHKLMLMSRGRVDYERLGRFVAQVSKKSVAEDALPYLLDLMQSLKVKATSKNHVNVLQHIQGYLKNHIDADDKKELVEQIGNYKRGQVPLIVPISLLNHFFRKYPNEYISQSYYMQAYPAEMSLQNLI